MAHLSIVGSHKVNGVSALHSDLLVQTIFADFASLWPERFTNMTNGVTPRRWLAQANPGLASLLDRTIGKRLATGSRPAATAWRRMPTTRSSPTPSWRSSAPTRRAWPPTSQRSTGIAVDPASLFDVQVKRIHEYKRQLLNVLQVVTRYQAILADPGAAVGAAHGDLRRQGRVELPHGQGDHPPDPRRGQRDQQRPA